MESMSIWLIVIATWALILVTYLTSFVDTNLIVFPLLTILVFSVVVDWLMLDSAKAKGKKEASVKV